jgi:hypothetical protein
VMRSRSAASVALNCFSVISAVSGDATLGRPPLARIHVPALPPGHRAVERGCRNGGPGTQTAVHS